MLLYIKKKHEPREEKEKECVGGSLAFNVAMPPSLKYQYSSNQFNSIQIKRHDSASLHVIMTIFFVLLKSYYSKLNFTTRLLF